MDPSKWPTCPVIAAIKRAFSLLSGSSVECQRHPLGDSMSLQTVIQPHAVHKTPICFNGHVVSLQTLRSDGLWLGRGFTLLLAAVSNETPSECSLIDSFKLYVPVDWNGFFGRKVFPHKCHTGTKALKSTWKAGGHRKGKLGHLTHPCAYTVCKRSLQASGVLDGGTCFVDRSSQSWNTYDPILSLPPVYDMELHCQSICYLLWGGGNVKYFLLTSL